MRGFQDRCCIRKVIWTVGLLYVAASPVAEHSLFHMQYVSAQPVSVESLESETKQLTTEETGQTEVAEQTGVTEQSTTGAERTGVTEQAATESVQQTTTEQTGAEKVQQASTEAKRTPKPFSGKKKPALTVTKALQKKVKLKWEKIKGATEYHIFRSTHSKTGYRRIAVTKKRSYTDKAVSVRHTYYYKVQAVQKTPQPDGSDTVRKGKQSKKKQVYVRPKTPRMVICGECYVEGIEFFTPELVPSNMRLVSKVGINTTNILKYPFYEGGKTAIEKVCEASFDRVYFLVGANEFLNNSPEYTVANFDRMRTILEKKNKHMEMVIIKISPQGRSGDFSRVKARKQYNDAYEAYANQHTNVYFCNATDVMDDGQGTLRSDCDGGDGCHWNPYSTGEVMKELKNWSLRELGSW